MPLYVLVWANFWFWVVLRWVSWFGCIWCVSGLPAFYAGLGWLVFVAVGFVVVGILVFCIRFDFPGYFGIVRGWYNIHLWTNFWVWGVAVGFVVWVYLGFPGYIPSG